MATGGRQRATTSWWFAGGLGLVATVLVGLLVIRIGDDGVDRPDGSVLLIGDSITVMAGLDADPPDGWDVDARSGRTTPEGIAIVEGLDLDEVEVVVVALGTNDHLDDAATYGTRVDRMLDAIGPGPRVIWVNVDSHTPELAGAATGVNAALDDASERHPQLSVGDWDAYLGDVGDGPGLRAGDGIHYDVAGSELRRAWTIDLVPGTAV